MRLVLLLQSLANSQEQRGRVLDNIIYCDRQIVFSRERVRQQIAQGPGCSCLPWKCVCVYLLLERGISFPSRSYTKKKCETLCVDAVHAMKSVPGEASERNQYQQTARLLASMQPNLMKLHLLHLWATENDIIVLANGFAFYPPPCVWHVQLLVHPCEGLTDVMIFLMLKRYGDRNCTPLICLIWMNFLERRFEVTQSLLRHKRDNSVVHERQ